MIESVNGMVCRIALRRITNLLPLREEQSPIAHDLRHVPSRVTGMADMSGLRSVIRLERLNSDRRYHGKKRLHPRLLRGATLLFWSRACCCPEVGSTFMRMLEIPGETDEPS